MTRSTASESDEVRALFGREGRVADVARGIDWARSPLGAVDAWSPMLHAVVRLAMDAPGPVMILWGPDHVALWNEPCDRTLAGDVREGFARPLFASCPETARGLRPLFERALSGESLVERGQALALAARGGVARFDLELSPVRERAGGVSGIFFVWRETARSEPSLQEREQRYRSLFDEMEEGYALCEVVRDERGGARDLRFLELNAAFSRLMEIEGEANVSGRLRSELLGDGAPEMMRELTHAVETRTPRRFEIRHPRLARWYDLRVHPRDGDRVALLFDDVTTRKHAERTLLEDDAFKTALLTLADRIRALDEPATIREAATDLLVRHLGAARARFIAYDPDAVPEVRAETVRTDPAAFRATTREDLDALLAKMSRGVPLAEADETSAQICVPLVKRGRVASVLTVEDTQKRDWTERDVATAVEIGERTWAAVERARAEAELRTSELRARRLLEEADLARAQAEAANRSKDDFLATLSHELRTPLSAILLWSGALRSGLVPPGDVARAVDAIAQSAETQSHLIEDLLDLSRLTSGKLALAPSCVDVRRMIASAIDTVKPLAAERGIALVTEVAADAGTALLDGTRMKQVLWNLLTNAVKFTPHGGEVRCAVGIRAGELAIDVRDTGEGIASEFMPHLFEKFRQADMGETRERMGLGIGLAVAKQLVELHGGSIHARSDGPGAGSVFSVRIPIDANLPIAGCPAPPREASWSSRGRLASLRVLLVEDDSDTREALRWLLERAGAEVTAVGTAREAVASLRDGQVLVSDLGLPGISGYELIERVANERRSAGRRPPPSCALSAHARDIDRRRAIDAGFDLYLAKPVTPERLIEAVADLGAILASEPER